MFFRKKKAINVDKERRETFLHSYDRIIRLVDRYMNTYNRDEAVYILDYLIGSMLDDVCSSVIVSPWISYPNGLLPEPFPDHYFDENNDRHEIDTGKYTKVELAESRIYVRPWNTDRTVDNLLSLMIKDFSYDKSNHYSYYYGEIDLCFVYNGNHSINAGRYLKKGEILSKELDLTLLYPHCKTDGVFWYNSHTDEKLREVSDFRLAAVYTLASMKHDIIFKS